MTQATQDPTLADILAEVRESRLELKAEVKRWDDRFFKFSEDTANRSLTFIGGATISFIAGVILLLIRS